MKRFLIALAFAVVAIFGTASARAATIDFGTLTPGVAVTATFSGSGGFGYGEYYTFTLATDATLFVLSGSPAGSAPSPIGTFGALDLDINLYRLPGIAPIASAVGLGGVPPTFTPISLMLNLPVTAGDYLLSVVGETPPPNTFFATTTILAIAPAATTPIPGAGLMLLTGLGGLAGLMHRRKKRMA